MNTMFWITVALFAGTYLGLAVGKVPGLRMDRCGIALVGATLMLVTGMLSFEQAFSSKCINYEALVLLFGMMIVVGMLRLSGFFERLVVWSLSRIRSPRMLLACVVVASGVLSAFLVNDIICLALTPLVLELTRKLRYDPVPHLLAIATASNVGSAGAITGNPQNMIIGILSRISYFRFSTRLFPIAMLGLVCVYVLLAWRYRARLNPPAQSVGLEHPESIRPASRLHGKLQQKVVLVTLLMVVLFFLLPGQYLAITALGAASLLLLGKVNPEKAYRQVDWTLLVMFAGLFIVVHSFRLHVVNHWHVEKWTWLLDRPIDLLSVMSALLSNLVSNVPAVLLFQPVIEAIPEASRETAWLALAMSSTFAGNLTLLGSVANLIVVEIARRDGTVISFVEYARTGIPLTLITLLLGVAWLSFVR